MMIPWQSLRIAEVWEDLGGPPIRQRRMRAWWRDGDGDNISISTQKNVWYDYARGEGGTCLHLVEVVLGVDRARAIRWLEERYGHPETIDAIRNRTDQAKIREYAELWKAGRVRELVWLKESLCGRRYEGDSDQRFVTACTWATATRELYLTERLEGEALRNAFIEAATTTPKDAARLIAAEQQHQKETADLAAMVVAMLAASAQKGARHAAA